MAGVICCACFGQANADLTVHVVLVRNGAALDLCCMINGACRILLQQRDLIPCRQQSLMLTSRNNSETGCSGAGTSYLVAVPASSQGKATSLMWAPP